MESKARFFCGSNDIKCWSNKFEWCLPASRQKTTSWQTLNVWSILPTFTRKKQSNVGTVKYSLYRVSGTRVLFPFQNRYKITTNVKCGYMIYQFCVGGGFKYFYFHPENWGKFPFCLWFFRWVGSTTNQIFFCTYGVLEPFNEKNPRGRRSWSIGRGTSTAPNRRSNDRVIFLLFIASYSHITLPETNSKSTWK